MIGIIRKPSYLWISAVLVFCTILLITSQVGAYPLSSNAYIPVENISVQFGAKTPISTLSADVESLFYTLLNDDNNGDEANVTGLNHPFGDSIDVQFTLGGEEYSFLLHLDTTVFKSGAVITLGGDEHPPQRFLPSLTTYKGSATTQSGKSIDAVFTLTPHTNLDGELVDDIQSGDYHHHPHHQPMSTPVAPSSIVFQGSIFTGEGEYVTITPVSHVLAGVSRDLKQLRAQASTLSPSSSNPHASSDVQSAASFAALNEQISETRAFMQSIHRISQQSLSLDNQSSYQLIAISSKDFPSLPCGSVSTSDDGDDVVEIEHHGHGDQHDGENTYPTARSPLSFDLPSLTKWKSCSSLTESDSRAVLKLSLTVDHGYALLVAGTNNNSGIPKVTANIASHVAQVNYVYENIASVAFTVSRLIIRTPTSEPWNKGLREACDASQLFNDFTSFANDQTQYGPRDAAVIHLITSCQTPNSVVGLAHVSGVCSTSGVGIGWNNLDRGDWKTLAHEIGHNFTLKHTFDANRSPSYPKEAGLGIMDYADGTLKADVVANDPNFGRVAFAELTDKQGLCGTIQSIIANPVANAFCLTIEHRNSPPQGTCGNGVVDFFYGEECDPGISPGCCTADCKMAPGAECLRTDSNSECCTTECKNRVGYCSNMGGFCTKNGCQMIASSVEKCEESRAFPVNSCFMLSGPSCNVRWSNLVHGFGYSCKLSGGEMGVCTDNGQAWSSNNVCTPSQYSWSLNLHRPCNCAGGSYYEINEYSCVNSGGSIVSSSFCEGIALPKPKHKWCNCSKAQSSVVYVFQGTPKYPACPAIECGEVIVSPTNPNDLSCVRTLRNDNKYSEPVASSFCNSAGKTCKATTSCGGSFGSIAFTCESNVCKCQNGFGGTRCTTEPRLSNLRVFPTDTPNAQFVPIGESITATWSYGGGAPGNIVELSYSVDGGQQIRIGTTPASDLTYTFTIAQGTPSSEVVFRVYLNNLYSTTYTTVFNQGCSSTPDYCGSNGTCNATTAACDCAKGFTGTHCDVDICDSLACQNGACNRDTEQCDCEPGYIGAACETDTCSLLDCPEDKSTCNRNTQSCDCTAPYFGLTCQKSPCDGVVCGEHGTCDQSTAQCRCDEGWTGQRCDEVTNPCQDNAQNAPPTCVNGRVTEIIGDDNTCSLGCECYNKWAMVPTSNSPSCTYCAINCPTDRSTPSRQCTSCRCAPGWFGEVCQCSEIYFSLSFTKASSPRAFAPLFQSLIMGDLDTSTLSTGVGFVQESPADLTPQQASLHSKLIDQFSSITQLPKADFRWVINHATFGTRGNTSSSLQLITLFFSIRVECDEIITKDVYKAAANEERVQVVYGAIQKIQLAFEAKDPAIVAAVGPTGTGKELPGEDTWPSISEPSNPLCTSDCPSGPIPDRPPEDSEDDGDGGLSDAVKIVIIVIAVVVGLALIIGLVVLLVRCGVCRSSAGGKKTESGAGVSSKNTEMAPVAPTPPPSASPAPPKPPMAPMAPGVPPAAPRPPAAPMAAPAAPMAPSPNPHAPPLAPRPVPPPRR